MLDGKRVIINVDKLLSNHNSVKFREFINANRDTVFTASLYGIFWMKICLLLSGCFLKMI